MRNASGNIYLKSGKRGATWHMRFRLPDGRESRRLIGSAWTEKGRPPEGYFTKKTAEAAKRQFLTDADRGLVPDVQRNDATVTDAVEEWLRFVEHEREVKPATLSDYKSVARVHLLPAFGDRRLDQVTTRSVEQWMSRLASNGASQRLRNKLLVCLHGVFERTRRTHGLQKNPVADVQRQPERYEGRAPDRYDMEEVRALVRAAEGEQDAALFLTAALTGLRMGELRALRWRNVDFAGEIIRVREALSNGVLTTPKGGKDRVVPMVPEVAQVLSKLWKRGFFTGDDDLVFPGLRGAKRFEQVLNAVDYAPEHDEIIVANYMDRSALLRRYKKARDHAGLRPLTFHELRHTFGSLAINVGSPVEVQAWMGHSSIQTTMRYLHYKNRGNEAQRLAQAFADEALALPDPAPVEVEA